MPDNESHFNFSATGVGSVPFLGLETTCRQILEDLPSIPFWPQFVKRSYLEYMNVQFSENLPLLKISEEKESVIIPSTENAESELVRFYDHFLAKDIDYFSISRDFAPGLYNMLELIDRGASKGGLFIKGQTVGPLTFAAGIIEPDGKQVLHNPELLEAMINGLAIKALWQVMELKKSGKKVIIFLDEPYLSGFGSAFSSVQRHEVIDILRTVINYIRKNSDALIGIHCCGNTDWSMIAESGPDIINFDAFEFMEYFLLYPDEIKKFIGRGGIIAWGIVPTSNYRGTETVEGLFSKLEKGLNHMLEWGIAPGLLAERSILTPACGMGSMTPETAKKGLELLSHLSMKLSGFA
ncbi:MAG: hypothetical protein J7L16_03900 [Deltaproteobacteria bacterium]|nr:hypothetical protein [Deltaproteobacteria bacterium]